MALTDEEKLNRAKNFLISKINTIETIAEFKTFIKGLTLTKVKKAITDQLQTEAETRNANSDREKALATDVLAYKTEINNIT